MARWARIHQRAGEPRRALRIISQGRRLLAGVPASDPAAAAATVKLDVLMANVRLGQEKPSEARRWASRAADEARESNDLESLARALNMIDHADWQLGLPIRGDHMREALRIFVTIGDLVGQAVARQNLGVLAFDAGRWVEALDWYESSRVAATKAGMDYGAAETELNIVEILINQGRLDDAEVILSRAVRVLRASGVEFHAAFGETLQARLHLARGDVEAAEAHAVRASAGFMALGSLQSALEAELLRADVAIRRGAADDALRIVAESEAASRGEDVAALQSQIHLVLARALVSLGRLREAEDEVSKGLNSARAQNLPFEEARLLEIRATLTRRQGGASAASKAAADAALADQLLSGMGIGS